MHVLSVLKAIPKLRGIFPPTTRDVLDAMVHHADAATRETFAPASKLARYASTNVRQVRRAFASLRDAGLIVASRAVMAGDPLPTPRRFEPIFATRATLVHRLEFEDGKMLLRIARTHLTTGVCADTCDILPQVSVRTPVTPSRSSVFLRDLKLQQRSDQAASARDPNTSPQKNSGSGKGPVLDLRSHVSGTRSFVTREREQATWSADDAARDFHRNVASAATRKIPEPLAEMKKRSGGCESTRSQSESFDLHRDIRTDTLEVLEHWKSVCDPDWKVDFTPRQFLIVGERLRDGWSVTDLCRAADGARATRWRTENTHALTVPGVFGTSEGVRACLKTAPPLSSLGVPARFATVTRIPARLDRQRATRATDSMVKNCEPALTGDDLFRAAAEAIAAVDFGPSSRVQRCP
jgi:hypothetical protein